LRKSVEAIRRIHCRRIRNRLEHAEIREAIAVGETAREVNAVHPGQMNDGALFCGAEHVIAGNFASPATVARDELRSDNREWCRKMPGDELCERSRSPGNQENAMALREMKCEAAKTGGEELQRTRYESRGPVLGGVRRDSRKIGFIGFDFSACISRHATEKAPSVTGELHAPDQTVRQEIKNKATLERGRRQQRAVEVEESSDIAARLHRALLVMTLDGAGDAAEK